MAPAKSETIKTLPLEIAKKSPHERQINVCEPVTIAQLLAGNVPKRRQMPLAQDIFFDIADRSLVPLTVTTPDSEEKMIIGPRLTGYDINSLFYLLTNDRWTDFSTVDLIEDWYDLFNEPSQKRRLATHKKMSGWQEYERSKDRVYGVIKRNFDRDPVFHEFGDFNQRNPHDVIVPVLRWRSGEDGQKVIILDDLEEGLRTTIALTLPEDPNTLDVGMGPVLLATYSPDQTQWPRQGWYKPTSPTKAPSQRLGPTQMLAFTLRKIVEQQSDPTLVPPEQDIQTSPLLAAMDEYLPAQQIFPQVA